MIIYRDFILVIFIVCITHSSNRSNDYSNSSDCYLQLMLYGKVILFIVHIKVSSTVLLVINVEE